MTDIFISYAREDKRFVSELVAALAYTGCTVWWDRDIEHGRHFDRIIEQELDAATVVIVVWSPDSRDSDWCRAEAMAALEQKKLLPIAIRRAKPPLRFSQVHTGDFSSWNGSLNAEPFLLLIRDLGAFGLAVRPDDGVKAEKSTFVSNSNQAKLIPALLLVGVVLLIGALGYLYWDREEIRRDRDKIAAIVLATAPPESESATNKLITLPLMWPVRGKISDGFGSTTSGRENDGINLVVPEGTPVKAAADGTVAYAGSELKGYGNLILLRHADGYVTAYAHLSEISASRGQQVKRGSVIGLAGQTGAVSAPQLHFEVRKGSKPVDPLPLLPGSNEVEKGPEVASNNTKDATAATNPTVSVVVSAMQRALTEFGYGQLKPTGLMDGATKQAIQKFQRDRKLPVTGDLDGRTVNDMSKMIGRPIP